MTTYKGIQGESLQTLASDPSPTVNYLGQLWYNSTSAAFKIAIDAGGVWATGTAIPTGTSDCGGAGTITAALMWGGTPFDNIGNITREFDGTSWTTGGTMTTILGGNAGTGTQTAAFQIGGHNGTGYQADSAMEYDGSTWTAVTQDPASSNGIRGTAGIQTAALTVGGSPASTNVTSLWSGSAWTTGGVYPVSKTGVKGNGTQAAAFMAGGNPGFIATANTFDGSTWTATGSLNTARGYGGTGGSTSVGLYFGGNNPSDTAATETFDGTSWAEAGLLGTARNSPAQGWGVGSANLGVLCMVGNAPSASTLVEEWANPVYSVKTVTVS